MLVRRRRQCSRGAGLYRPQRPGSGRLLPAGSGRAAAFAYDNPKLHRPACGDDGGGGPGHWRRRSEPAEDRRSGPRRRLHHHPHRHRQTTKRFGRGQRDRGVGPRPSRPARRPGSAPWRRLGCRSSRPTSTTMASAPSTPSIATARPSGKLDRRAPHRRPAVSRTDRRAGRQLAKRHRPGAAQAATRPRQRCPLGAPAHDVASAEFP